MKIEAESVTGTTPVCVNPEYLRYLDLCKFYGVEPEITIDPHDGSGDFDEERKAELEARLLAELPL